MLYYQRHQVAGETMDKITLKNYRCFHDEQSARLAPLTLLVGENSTGKTSFMAMIRALWDVTCLRLPDFKEEPYDLGSFNEIAHHRGSRGSQAKNFEAGFDYFPSNGSRTAGEPYHFKVTFGERRGSTPVPTIIRFAYRDTWVEHHFKGEWGHRILAGTSRGTWEMKQAAGIKSLTRLPANESLSWLPLLTRSFFMDSLDNNGLRPLQGSPRVRPAERKQFATLAHSIFKDILYRGSEIRPFASAPVRSKPRRTYDPSRLTQDPEGDYIPMYLANLHFQNKKEWEDLKEALEDFGKASGLFDEIFVKVLGKRDSEPFQLQFRNFGRRRKGPRRNLIDMGYGVSQVLPVITELLRRDAPQVFLLQQPGVHLHPKAQAALGSLFCRSAGTRKRQLMVETHSDQLIDRVCMDVRDHAKMLKPDDVSILYFERGALDVTIHSLRIDKKGNILDAPETYRDFFMEETKKYLGY